MKDSTEAFQRALNGDESSLHVDSRHEKGCVLRYGAVPENGSEYIDHPERCPCHAATGAKVNAMSPNYRWFDFDPKDDITLADLVAIFKAMRLSLSEDILAANPRLFKHFKVRAAAVTAPGTSP